MSSQIKKIESIEFRYEGHDAILINIAATINGEKRKYMSDLIMKIDEEKENKYFNFEKMPEQSTLENRISKVYYYDRITASLESDIEKKEILKKVFEKTDNQNVLLLYSDYKYETFENIKTSEIKFKISNNSIAKKQEIDNIENLFFTSSINTNHLDILNSLRFSLISTNYAKSIIEKISKNIANAMIRDYPDAFNENVTINDSAEISSIVDSHLQNRFLRNEISLIISDSKINLDDFFESTKEDFAAHFNLIEKLTDIKSLRNFRTFVDILNSEESQTLARTNIPLQNEINIISRTRFDTLLVNPDNEQIDINALSDFYKTNHYGNLCIQSNEDAIVNKNTYLFEVKKDNLKLSISPSMKKSSESINKIIDLRNITNLELRKKIFESIYSDTNKNITFITKDEGDISFIYSRLKNGNIYKLDSKYFNEETNETIYIADVLEISYSYENNFQALMNPYDLSQIKKIIEFPKYDETLSYIKNAANIKSEFVKKVNNFESSITGRIESLYKYDFLYSTMKDFNAVTMSKDFTIAKKAEEFYSFALKNIGKYFSSNSELIFSSFNVAKDKKVFNNDFYYGLPSKISIENLETSIALSSHIARMPTGDIISKIAKKFNVDIKSSKPFSLSDTEQNKLNIGQKEFVTSSKLGAMKFGYLPKTFELKDEDKKILLNIVDTILNNNGVENIEHHKTALAEVMNKASFMVLKNEQSVIDNKRFAPKEVLVLIDENLEDISKINISTSDFYNELENREIFNIFDYIEIAKINSSTLERITSGIGTMINDFKKEHFKYSNIDDNIIQQTIERNKLDKILIADDKIISKDKKDETFYKIATILKTDEYYKTFLEFESTEDIINLIDKQPIEQKVKSELKSFIYKNFDGNEIKLVEQNNKELFDSLKEKIPDEQIYKKIEEKIYKVYNDKKVEHNILVKTAKFYVIGHMIDDTLNVLNNIDKNLSRQEYFSEKSKIYSRLKKLLDITCLEIMGLRVAQYHEALNFAILNNNQMKNSQMLFWEMREGKSRTGFISKLFAGFANPTKNNTRNLMFVQNKNLDDIAKQLVDCMPIIAKDITFVANEKIYMFKENKSLSLPVNISKQITPQLITMFKDIIKFQGQKDNLKSDSVILSASYTSDMNQIYKNLQNYNIDDIIHQFRTSPFIKLLDLTNNKKVDKDIENSILQSFLYIQMIYERKFLKAHDADVIIERMSNFVDNYINSKQALKNLHLSKFGVDVLPKNILYSINVDSPVTNVDVDKKLARSKVGKGYLTTPFNIETSNEIEHQLFVVESPETKKEFYSILRDSFSLPFHLKNLSLEGKVYLISSTDAPIDILIEKEKIASSLLYKNLKNASENFIEIMDAYIKEQISDANLIKSKYYRLDGIDDLVNDTIEVDLKDIFEITKVNTFLSKYEDYERDKEALIDLLNDETKIQEHAISLNEKQYFNTLEKVYDTTLSSNVSKRLELISPLIHKKYKELSASFIMDLELSSHILVYPIRKKQEDNATKYFYDTYSVYSEKVNLNDLSKNIRMPVEKLRMEFSYSKSLPNFTLKFEQDKSLMLDFITKKNENLNNTYIVDINPKTAQVTIDESHKGLKKNSSNLNIHDVTSYLHKVALKNNGTFTSISGTPISGKAKDIGKIMTTGVDISLSTAITKDIETYCTSYEFKDELDAIIFSALEIYPNGVIYNSLNRLLTIPSDKTLINPEFLKLTEKELEGFKEELSLIVSTIPNLDSDEKKDLTRNVCNNIKLNSKIDFYIGLFKIENDFQKLMNDKKVNKKDNDLKSMLYGKIKELAKQVPGINNFATLADIIKKIGNENSINISRTTEDSKYNILDIEMLKKQNDAREIKSDVNIAASNYKNKILTLGAYLDGYKGKLKLAEVKERISKIFESWVVDMFSESNYNKSIRFLGLTSKFGIREATSSEAFYSEKINELMSKSGKSVNDSSMDIFNTLYFGSEKEKFNLAEDKNYAEKVEFVISLIDKFIEFTNKYTEFQAKSKVVYENEMLRAKEQPLEKDNFLFDFDGFKFDASKYEDISPEMDSLYLFNPLTQDGFSSKVSLSNDGAILVDNMPIVFKTELVVNKWEHFLKDPLFINFSLTNKGEHEILEYLAADSIPLYLEHLNKGENIRLMSGRNATLAISLMDAIESLVKREDKSKTAVLLFNKNSSKSYDFSKIINSIDEEVLKNNNISLKVTQSSTFDSALYETQKNKNIQIVVVGNYVALAEGIDMSCIDTGFYVGSLKESAETIQSFARQRNHDKEVSNIYLGNNGLFDRYKLKNSFSIPDITLNNTPFRKIARELFKGEIELLDSKENDKLNDLTMLNYYSTTSSIVLSTNITLARLEAYEAVMSGKYPKQDFDYDVTPLISFSKTYEKTMETKKEELNTEQEVDLEISIIK